MSVEGFLETPEGRALATEMAEDLLYHKMIMPDTTARTREAMEAYGRQLMASLLKKDQN